MGNWNEIFSEIERSKRDAKNPHDIICQKYLKKFADKTGRNALVYYSGWLQKTGSQFENSTGINDEDKNGFMACFHGMKFEKGLDLFIHSPGGDVAATESIIHYLRSKFQDNIRVFVPQLSMSGGTMIALAGKEIWMGSHSNLGPIDPQFGSQPARLVLEEFDKAKAEIMANSAMADVWRPILEQIPPTFLTTCDNAIKWSKDIAVKALTSGMLKNDNDAQGKAEKIADDLTDVAVHKNHSRHLHRDECEAIGLNIKRFENDQVMQDMILSVHHSFILMLMNTLAVKIIQNHKGVMFGKAGVVS